MEVNRKFLLDALKRLGDVINRNTILPSLSCVLFHLGRSLISITATNLEMQIDEEVPCKDGFNSSRKALVDHRWICGILSNYDCENITIKEPVDEDGNKSQVLLPLKEWKPVLVFKIICDGDEHQIACMSVGDFPKPSIVENELSFFTRDLTPFCKQLDIALRFTSTDDLRPAMTGVYLDAKNFDHIMVVSTDAHSLYNNNSLLDIKSSEFGLDGVILPKRLCAFVSKNMISICKVIVGENNISIQSTTTTVICRYIDARYPDYTVALPVPDLYQFKAVFNRVRLMRVTKVSMFVSNQSTGQLTLQVRDYREGNLTFIKAEDVDFSYSSLFKIECDSSGDVRNIDIAFNGKILGKILSCIKDEKVTFQNCGSNTKAFIINDSFLLMPLHFNQ